MTKNKQAKIIYTAAKAKYTDKKFQPLLDEMQKLYHAAVMSEARAKDKLDYWEGQILIVKEHTIQYNNIHRQYKDLAKDNKKLFAENQKLKRKANKYLGWIKKQFKKWRKRKAKALKKINKEYKDGNT